MENRIVIVKKEHGNDIEKVPVEAGLHAVGATAYNLNQLTQLLKEMGLPNAAVFSWNGQPSRLVLQQSGELNPYDPLHNPTDYVFCERRSN